MTNESDDLSTKSWQRAVASINKASILIKKLWRLYYTRYMQELCYIVDSIITVLAIIVFFIISLDIWTEELMGRRSHSSQVLTKGTHWDIAPDSN